MSAPSTGARILVVDDDNAIRETLRAILEDEGYPVAAASNGREALEKFRNGRFDLVVTDKAMPEMDGDQLAVAIKQLNPQQPIILLTGFSELADNNPKSSNCIDLVVSKPVSMLTLRQALADVIAA